MIDGDKICICIIEIEVVVFVWVRGCVKDVAVTAEYGVHCIIDPPVVPLISFFEGGLVLMFGK